MEIKSKSNLNQISFSKGDEKKEWGFGRNEINNSISLFQGFIDTERDKGFISPNRAIPIYDKNIEGNIAGLGGMALIRDSDIKKINELVNDVGVARNRLKFGDKSIRLTYLEFDENKGKFIDYCSKEIDLKLLLAPLTKNGQAKKSFKTAVDQYNTAMVNQAHDLMQLQKANGEDCSYDISQDFVEIDVPELSYKDRLRHVNVHLSNHYQGTETGDLLLEKFNQKDFDSFAKAILDNNPNDAIFLDNLYKEIKDLVKNMDEIGFDKFDLSKSLANNDIKSIFNYMLRDINYTDTLNRKFQILNDHRKQLLDNFVSDYLRVQEESLDTDAKQAILEHFQIDSLAALKNKVCYQAVECLCSIANVFKNIQKLINSDDRLVNLLSHIEKQNSVNNEIFELIETSLKLDTNDPLSLLNNLLKDNITYKYDQELNPPENKIAIMAVQFDAIVNSVAELTLASPKFPVELYISNLDDSDSILQEKYDNKKTMMLCYLIAGGVLPEIANSDLDTSEESIENIEYYEAPWI